MRVHVLLAALLCPGAIGAQTHSVTAKVTLRAVPTTAGQALASVPQGGAVQLQSCTHAGGEWCAVLYAGRKGYLQAKHLGPEQEVATGSGVAARQSASVTEPSTTRSLMSDRAPPSSSRASSAASPFIRGPRGGCYTLSKSGNKRYVDRSLC